MLGMYGHTWASQYGDHAAGETADTWASALIGITPQQIADGLRACVAEGAEFPPNAPRFRAMCLGIPTFATVKREMLRPHDERSKFTRAVWARVDQYAHRIASMRDADRMLESAYDEVRDAVMRGEMLPDIAGVLDHDTNPKPQGIPSTREARSQHLAQMLANLGELYNPATADPNYDPHEAHRDQGRVTADEVRSWMHAGGPVNPKAAIYAARLIAAAFGQTNITDAEAFSRARRIMEPSSVFDAITWAEAPPIADDEPRRSTDGTIVQANPMYNPPSADEE